MLYIAVIDNVKRKMVKVVKAKKCKLQGARAYACARTLDSFFLTYSVFSSSVQPDLCRVVVKKAGIHR